MNFSSSGLNGDEGLGDYQAVFFTAGRRHLCGQMSRLDKDLCSGQVFDQKKIEADEGGFFFAERREAGLPVTAVVTASPFAAGPVTFKDFFFLIFYILPLLRIDY